MPRAVAGTFGAPTQTVTVTVKSRNRHTSETQAFVIHGKTVDHVAEVVEAALTRAYGRTDDEEREDDRSVITARPVVKARRKRRT